LLILVSENSLDLEFATALAKAIGVELRHPRNFTQEIDDLRNHPRAEVIFSLDQADLYPRIEAKLLSPEFIRPRFHFISYENLDCCRPALQSPFFLSQIRRSDSMSRSVDLFARLCAVRLKGEMAELDHLMPGQLEQDFMIDSNLEKTSVLEGLKKFLLGAQLGERNLDTVVTAADELLMNAIFDAPVDEMGTRISIGTTRTSPIRLQGRRRIKMKAGYNLTHVAVEVRDFFGSLEQTRLFDKLSEVYGLNDYKVDQRSAGAGLGLANVHRSGGSLIFHCEAGELTAVTVLFARLETAQKLRDHFRFIQL
jgi:hypothetical protein